MVSDYHVHIFQNFSLYKETRSGRNKILGAPKTFHSNGYNFFIFLWKHLKFHTYTEKTFGHSLHLTDF